MKSLNKNYSKVGRVPHLKTKSTQVQIWRISSPINANMPGIGLALLPLVS
jgi:hypothetical protein